MSLEHQKLYVAGEKVVTALSARQFLSAQSEYSVDQIETMRREIAQANPQLLGSVDTIIKLQRLALAQRIAHLFDTDSSFITDWSESSLQALVSNLEKKTAHLLAFQDRESLGSSMLFTDDIVAFPPHDNDLQDAINALNQNTDDSILQKNLLTLILESYSEFFACLKTIQREFMILHRLRKYQSEVIESRLEDILLQNLLGTQRIAAEMGLQIVHKKIVDFIEKKYSTLSREKCSQLQTLLNQKLSSDTIIAYSQHGEVLRVTRMAFYCFTSLSFLLVYSQNGSMHSEWESLVPNLTTITMSMLYAWSAGAIPVRMSEPHNEQKVIESLAYDIYDLIFQESMDEFIQLVRKTFNDYNS